MVSLFDVPLSFFCFFVGIKIGMYFQSSLCVYMHMQRDKSLLGTMPATKHLPESSIVRAFCSLSCSQCWQKLFLREKSEHQQNVFLVR